MKYEDFPVPLRIEAHQIAYTGCSRVQNNFRYTYNKKSADVFTDKGEPIDQSGVIYAYCGIMKLDDEQRVQIVIFGTPHFTSTIMPIEVHIINDSSVHMQAVLARAIKIASIKRKG